MQTLTSTTLALLIAFLCALNAGLATANAQEAPVNTLGNSMRINAVAGVQKVLVIGCYYSDTPDPSELDKAMDGIRLMYGPASQVPSIADFFMEESSNRIEIESTVMGWYALPSTESTYANGSSQENDCYTRVNQVVSDIASYNVVVTLFNYDTGMTNHTLSQNGQSWIYLRPWGGHGGWSNMSTHVHELGHAFGLQHSHTDTDPTNPYSNEFDTMSGLDDSSQTYFFWNGFGWWCNGYAMPNLTDLTLWGLAKCMYPDTEGPKHVPVQFSAYQRIRAGWLSAGTPNTATFHGGDASYHLQPLQSQINVSNLQMIAIPDVGTDLMYTVELRQKSAGYYDKGLPKDAVVVYRINPSDIDKTPGDATRVAVLDAGQSYANGTGLVIGTSPSDLSQIKVHGPKQVPTLTGLQPNFGSSQRTTPAGTLPVTVQGTDFVPATVASWPGYGMLGGATIGSGFVDTQTLSVRVPESLLHQGRSTFVSVTSGEGNNPQLAGQVGAFWVTPSGAATANSATATQSVAWGTATVASGKLSLKAPGTGAIAATSFTSNPGGSANFASADRWFGVLIGPDPHFDRVDMVQCDTNGGTSLRWWQGTQWTLVNPAPRLDAAGCLYFTANATSQPSVSDVANGALFGIGRAMQLAPVTAPAPVDEGSTLSLTGSILNPSTDVMGLNVDWGDGHADNLQQAAGSAAYTVSHRYVDNPRGTGAQGTYPVQLSLADAHGSVASTARTSATVRNVAPTVQLTTYVQTIAPNTPLNLYVHFADPGVAGTEGDTESAAIDWGDGQVDHVAVPIAQVGFAAQHSYKDNPAGGLGKLTIGVQVTDDDGGTGSATTPISVTYGVAATQVMTCFDVNYGGTCLMILQDYPDLRVGTAFNDQISSIKISGPATVSVYSDINYQGTCETFTASDPQLADNRIGDNTISSIRLGVACPTP